MAEHWLEEGQTISMEGFKLASIYYRQGRRGGAAIYVKENLQVTEREDLVKLSIDTHAEIAAVDIVGTLLTVISVYRTPDSDMAILTEKIEELFSKTAGRKLLIGGDFNVELRDDSCSKRNRLIDVTGSAGLRPTCLLPTRQLRCLDTIFAAITPMFCTSKVENYGVSDHNAVELEIFGDGLQALKTQAVENPTLRLQRNYSDENKIKFIEELEKIPWESIINNDVNESFESFHNLIKELFDEIFPWEIKKDRKKTSHFENSPDMLRRMNKLRDLKIMASQCEDLRIKECYKVLRFSISNDLKKEQAARFQKKLEESQNKTKTLWSALDQFKGRGKNGNKGIARLMVENTEITDPEEVANAFNEYYSTEAAKLVAGRGVGSKK